MTCDDLPVQAISRSLSGRTRREAPAPARFVGGGHHEHMGSLVGTSVLVSAFTSTLVALAVEWMAKPRLEARKEQLLALHRGRRTFEKNLHIILGNAAKLATGAAHGIPRGTEEELRRAIRAEADRAASHVEAATKDMSDNGTVNLLGLSGGAGMVGPAGSVSEAGVRRPWPCP